MTTAGSDSIRILAVDDDERCSVFLPTASSTWDTSRTGVARRTAIEMVEKNHYDIMLLDLRMPEMGGLQALERIRAIDSELAVIIMTAHVTVDSAVKAMKLGAKTTSEAARARRPQPAIVRTNAIAGCASSTASSAREWRPWDSCRESSGGARQWPISSPHGEDRAPPQHGAHPG